MPTSAMHVAKTGINAQQTKIQVIANNLANVNTTGFKRDRANFETLLYQVQRTAGEQTSDATALTSGLSVGTGVRVINTQKVFSQGSLINTDNALDIAIDGEGFFQVLLPDGRFAYTRDGTLSKNPEGTLTTSSGFVIQPEVVIPADVSSINISSDGFVSAIIAGETLPQEIGQLQLGKFANSRGLQPIGENFLVETAASGVPAIGAPLALGFGKLVQGSLEGSNVNVVQQLVDMIETQRAYEVSSKTISSVDEMLRYINNNL